MFSDQGHGCAVHSVDLVFPLVEAGGLDPELETILMYPRDWLTRCCICQKYPFQGEPLDTLCLEGQVFSF